MPGSDNVSATKKMACWQCGTFVEVSKYRSKKVRCLDCAAKAFEDNARQISAHSGPWYEAWLAAGGARGRPRGRGRGLDKHSLIFAGQGV